MNEYINSSAGRTLEAGSMNSNSRFVKAEKTQSTKVIGYFLDEHKTEVGSFGQSQNKKGYQSLNCILRMISQWVKNTLKIVLNLTDKNKTANALHYHRYVNQPSNSSLNPMFSKLGYLEVKCK